VAIGPNQVMRSAAKPPVVKPYTVLFMQINIMPYSVFVAMLRNSETSNKKTKSFRDFFKRQFSHEILHDNRDLSAKTVTWQFTL